MNANPLFRVFPALFACVRGAIAVELGLLAPIIGTIALGMFEFTGAIEQSMELTNAARAGVEYATKYPTDTAGIQNAVIASGTISPTDLSITVNQFCECPDSAPIACTDTCAGGIQNDIFMRVALAQPAKSLLASTGLLPGRSVNASATLRLR